MAKHKREGAPAPEDAVGYGRPPKEHRFREGTVPNPWGRKGKPKPKLDFLDERQKFRIEGRERWITRDEAIDHFLYKQAMAGKVSAAQELDRRQKRRIATKAGGPEAERLSADEEAAMLRFLERSLRPAPDDAEDTGGRP